MAIKFYYNTDDNNFDNVTLHMSDISEIIKIKLLDVAALLLLIRFDCASL